MNEQAIKMQLDALRRNQAEAAAAQAAEVVKEQLKAGAKKLATRAVLRLAGGAAAVTLVGIFITYAIWTIQFWSANVLRSKIIPKLELWEIICWVSATLLGMALLIMVGVIFQLMADPWKIGEIAWAQVTDWWAGLFKNKIEDN